MLVYGLAVMRSDTPSSYRSLVWFAAAVVGAVVLQLVPLPSSVWQALPGRDIIAKVDAAAGLGNVWRPLSMWPAATWNSLFSLLVPCAALVLGISTRRQALPVIGLALISIGLISAILGGLQVLGPHSGPLYFYKYTNQGSPVGLFANRNHQAAFLACLIPVAAALAAAAGQSEKRPAYTGIGLASVVSLLFLVILLATGSRAGFLLAMVAVLCVPYVYGVNRAGLVELARAHGRRFVAAILTLAGILAGLAYLGLSSRSFARFGDSGTVVEQRSQGWPVVSDLSQQMFPWGSGYGSFDPVFRVAEPAEMLQRTYFNHAHNDYLEVAMTGGLVGIGLILAAAALYGAGLIAMTRNPDKGRAGMFGRAGAVILVVLAAASVVDYPLRVPSLSALAVIAALWMAAAASRQGSETSR